MQLLPSPITPLNQHSLVALESWLSSLGAQRSSANPCLWEWALPESSAEIEVRQDELRVTWAQGINKSQFNFPYGLSRQDVEAALKQGP